MTIKTLANDTYDERIAHIIIKVGKITQSIVVTQKQKDTIIVAKNEYFIEEELVDIAKKYKNVLFFEESVEYGSIAEHFGSMLYSEGFKGNYKKFCVSGFVPHMKAENAIKKG